MPTKRAKKIRVAVVFGGKSGEHDVSLQSAAAVMENLDPRKYDVVPVKVEKNGNADWTLMQRVDIAFPLVHGTFGEDGALQGLLEMFGVPYVGSGVLGSAVGMDKVVQKQVLAAAGLPIVRYAWATEDEWAARQLAFVRRAEKELRYPMFVKPANLGSSVGISKAHHRKELLAGAADAFRYDRKIIVEAAVPDAREIECAVLGGETPETSVLGEVVPSNEFYDYDAKYVSGASRIIVPADLPAKTTATMRALAVRTFATLCAYGMARVDFFLSKTGRAIVINEINTLPGFTRHSMYAKLWEASGLPFSRLLDKLVRLALSRAAADRRLKRTFAPEKH